jgi:hypothetical protein
LNVNVAFSSNLFITQRLMKSKGMVCFLGEKLMLFVTIMQAEPVLSRASAVRTTHS